MAAVRAAHLPARPLSRFAARQPDQALVVGAAPGFCGRQVFQVRAIDQDVDVLQQRQVLELDYQRLKGTETVRRTVEPVGILFSEYYFYLTAFIDDEEVRKDFDVINDSFPTIYRIDRIKKLKLLDEKFHIPYSSRFEEGEFRKRIQFMYGGKLHKLKFKYSGIDIDAILDRLPTATILTEEDGIYTVQAEVFGNGIDMWLRSQESNITLF